MCTAVGPHTARDGSFGDDCLVIVGLGGDVMVGVSWVFGDVANSA